MYFALYNKGALKKEGNIIRLTDLIGPEDIKKWRDGNSIVTIDAQVGKGKSYFIKNILYEEARRKGEKVLFLVHRLTCYDQFYKELEKDNKLDVIQLQTYQYIDAQYKKGCKYDFSKYQWIVCDEFHYHFSDSWNRCSDLSLDAILAASTKVRIFMSATGDGVKKFINNMKGHETIDYAIPKDFSYIRKLEFYKNRDSVHDYLKKILATDEKAIVFIKSAKRAHELHKLYQEKSMFLCSKSNKYYQFVDEEKRNDMLVNQKFDAQILFTTLTLEAGVNLIDPTLVNVICDIDFEVGAMQQAMGRKRIECNTDYINLYIKAPSNKTLGGKKAQLQKEVDIGNQFIFSSDTEFVQKYYRENLNNIIYDEPTAFGVEKRLNFIRYYKVQDDIEMIDEMIAMKNKNYGYCKYVSELFGVPYTIKEEGEVMSELEVYLDSLVGKKLFSDEREVLIQKVGLKDSQYRLQRGINQINIYFEENQMMYRLVNPPRKSIRDKETNKVKKEATHWIVSKLIS